MFFVQAVENSARQAKDEPLLPDDDINKMFRPIPTPPRLNPMIVAGQINAYGQAITQFCSQSLAKLYVTQALQNAKEGGFNVLKYSRRGRTLAKKNITKKIICEKVDFYFFFNSIEIFV